jgi:hypothetical protein
MAHSNIITLEVAELIAPPSCPATFSAMMQLVRFAALLFCSRSTPPVKAELFEKSE